MSEKQFPPSVKRLQKARKEGKVVKSRMVSVCVAWWVLILTLTATLSWVRSVSLIQWANYKVWTPQVAFAEGLREAFTMSALIAGALAGGGLFIGIVQTKGLLLSSQLSRGFEQYKPGAFVGRARQSFVDAWFGCVRCAVVILSTVPIVSRLAWERPTVTQVGTSQALGVYWSLVRTVVICGAVSITIIAIASYALARWKFFRQLRMSLQELKDEYKEDEGDPHAKSARKHEHRALLFAEVEQRIKRSKVVIVSRARLGGS